MLDVYESDFSVELCPKLPDAKEESRPVGGYTEGCRIGFDAGGSNRKVSSVIDGVIVYLSLIHISPRSILVLRETPGLVIYYPAPDRIG